MEKETNLSRKHFFTVVAGVIAISFIVFAFSAPSTILDVFLPGSQDGESGTFTGPDNCASCHGGYDEGVEPTFNWQGSMMAQAARDPLYEACLAISNQDVPESGDLCIRCHSPEGWLGGRSVPTDGSALTDADMEGIHCDFCHRMVPPQQPGVNPYPLDADYTSTTWSEDQAYITTMVDSLPPSSANGMYLVSDDGSRRGPFADPGAKHSFLYSPFYSESAYCGTCHDVSNPVYERQPDDSYLPNDFGEPATTYDTYELFPVERTYSEWIMSAYNSEEGIYSPQFGGNKQYVSTCQDCHMRDVSGVAANKNSAVFRYDQPLHDMTGGNTFIPELLKSLFPSDVNAVALDSGIVRARRMLQLAANMDLTLTTEEDYIEAVVRVTNETGHKLPSGYPEGRRIWINVLAKDASGTVIYESGHFDAGTGVLTKDSDIKVYEIKPGIDNYMAGVSGLPEGPSFHFVLNNKIFSDNRIPPRGFTNTGFEMIQSPPVNYTYADGQYWDDTEYELPLETDTVEVYLYYQTLSKEYVEFLRDENVSDDAGDVLYNLWNTNGKSAPELMNYASAKALHNNNNDSDGDGINDSEDNCPDIANADQTDADDDGAGAACDCDDNDPQVKEGYTWYADTDGDGYGDPDVSVVACSMPQDYVSNADDCDDSDHTLLQGTTYYADTDGDGYGDPDNTVFTCDLPTGYVDNADDCDDSDFNITLGDTWYADTDGDGYGDAGTTTVACTMPDGYVDNADDCDDADFNITVSQTWYADADGDGYGDPAVSVVACSMPQDYESNADDCDDTNPDIYPGAPALPDGEDNDCDGNVDKVAQTINFATIGDQQEDIGSIQLAATASSGLEVTFTTDDEQVSVSGSTLTVTGPGTVTVTAHQAGNEGYLAANPVTQTFCINPSKPVIQHVTREESEILISSSMTGNQWYLDGLPVTGATGDTLEVEETGYYSLQVELDQCVSIISDEVHVEITGIAFSSEEQIKVYPNPVEDKLLFRLPAVLEQNELRITIIDATGRAVLDRVLLQRHMGTSTVDVRMLDPGAYNYLILDITEGKIYRGLVVHR